MAAVQNGVRAAASYGPAEDRDIGIKRQAPDTRAVC
jgi:hypothetical protein